MIDLWTFFEVFSAELAALGLVSMDVTSDEARVRCCLFAGPKQETAFLMGHLARQRDLGDLAHLHGSVLRAEADLLCGREVRPYPPCPVRRRRSAMVGIWPVFEGFSAMLSEFGRCSMRLDPASLVQRRIIYEFREYGSSYQARRFVELRDIHAAGASERTLQEFGRVEGYTLWRDYDRGNRA